MLVSALLLLAEDEYLVALSTRAALEAGGYTVLSVESGPEALRLLSEGIQAFAGLITDIRLGDGPDGWEIARHARTLNPDLPVVYTTGDSADQWPINGVPMSVCVQKPYAEAQVIAAIAGLLNREG